MAAPLNQQRAVSDASAAGGTQLIQTERPTSPGQVSWPFFSEYLLFTDSIAALYVFISAG
jgi:hypothetical protein